MRTYTDKELLTHFPIYNMMDELALNRVSKSRRNEIVRKYKKVLNDDQYYCISSTNFINDILASTYRHKEVVVKNFKFGYYGSTIYLCRGEVTYNGVTIPVIRQDIDPKTGYELRNMKDWRVFYFSKKDIDKVCEGLVEKDMFTL